MWKHIIKCRDEQRNTREFLYWFTHQELRPVHLGWNSLKTDTINYTYTAVLEPFKNFNNQGWKRLFHHTLHSKKPYLEWLTLKPITIMNKEKITPETCCKNINQLFYLLQDSTIAFIQHKVIQEQAHIYFPFEKPLQKPFQFTFSHKMLYLCQNCDCSASLHVRRIFYFIENSFKPLFKKQLQSSLENNRLILKTTG